MLARERTSHTRIDRYLHAFQQARTALQAHDRTTTTTTLWPQRRWTTDGPPIRTPLRQSRRNDAITVTAPVPIKSLHFHESPGGREIYIYIYKFRSIITANDYRHNAKSTVGQGQLAQSIRTHLRHSRSWRSVHRGSSFAARAAPSSSSSLLKNTHTHTHKWVPLTHLTVPLIRRLQPRSICLLRAGLNEGHKIIFRNHVPSD